MANKDTDPRISKRDKQSKKRTLLLGLYVFLTLLLTVVVGGVIGALATDAQHPFNWDTASVAATAFATIALAIGTVILAVSALEDAGASRDLAWLTREEMRRHDRPTIAIADFDFIPEDSACEFTIGNAGLGPAIHINYSVVGLDSTGDYVVASEPAAIPHILFPAATINVRTTVFVRGNVEDLATMELFLAAVDRRGIVSYGLWRRKLHQGIFLAASDFGEVGSENQWTPSEELLSRLSSSVDRLSE